MAFVGCNKTESPKEVVSEYFEDIKFNDENELVNLNKRDNKWKLSIDDELSKLVLGNVSK